MVDLSDKGSESEDMASQTPTPDRGSPDHVTGQVKICADCGTTKTPLWRGGPAGPKSLCNACGIRSRKKRRALLGLNKDDKKAKKSSPNVQKNISRQNSSSSSSTTTSISGDSSSNNSNKKPYDLSKKKMFSFGKDVAVQRPRSSMNHRRKLGEEEQAAFLLMALSCGAVFG